jgi:hypothetical protein
MLEEIVKEEIVFITETDAGCRVQFAGRTRSILFLKINENDTGFYSVPILTFTPI